MKTILKQVSMNEIRIDKLAFTFKNNDNYYVTIYYFFFKLEEYCPSFSCAAETSCARKLSKKSVSKI